MSLVQTENVLWFTRFTLEELNWVDVTGLRVFPYCNAVGQRKDETWHVRRKM